MLQQNTHAYITKHRLFGTTDSLLVAFSGGADSVALLHILLTLGYKVAAAHVNFNLRGEEANADEEFCRAFCAENKIPFHHTSFDTKAIAKTEGESLQMAARRLRYTWFDALCKTHNYHYVAVGHHANDNAETFFINLSRKTGLNGLTGIKPANGIIVRPLLFASRQVIETYLTQHNLPYRTDSSNQNTKYQRNYIRHKVLPALEKQNPAFVPNLIDTMGLLNDSYIVLKKHITETLEAFLTEENGAYYLPISELEKLQPLQPYLFEWLAPFNFNSTQIAEIAAHISNGSGATYQSGTHTLYRDRTHLILAENIPDTTTQVFTLGKDLITSHLNFGLKAEVIQNTSKINLKQPPHILLADYNSLQWPLTIRTPQRGDRMQPFGMKGFKLLSDLFNNAKYTALKKQQAKLVVSSNDIVWVAGLRSDARFAVTPKTTQILRLELVY